MKNKVSDSVTVFAILIILGSAIQLFGMDFDSLKILMQPLSDKMVLAYLLIVEMLLITGLVAAVGLFWAKDIFRKLILIHSSFCIFSYVFIAPFFEFKNTSILIELEVSKILAQNSGFPEAALPVLFTVMWVLGIAVCVIDFCFSIVVIYFFTRPGVKKQFN